MIIENICKWTLFAAILVLGSRLVLALSIGHLNFLPNNSFALWSFSFITLILPSTFALLGQAIIAYYAVYVAPNKMLASSICGIFYAIAIFFPITNIDWVGNNAWEGLQVIQNIWGVLTAIVLFKKPN